MVPEEYVVRIAGRSRLRSLVQSLLVLSVTTLVMLLLAEGAVRIFMPQYLRPVFREQVGGANFTRADLHARIASPGEFDTRANTTTQRLRGDRLYALTPPAGTFRIAVIGDSYVFGTGAEDHESYPSVLEAALSGKARRRIEVLNAGIHGSGTSDQVIWFDRWVSSFHPQLVVLTVYGGNDVCDEIHSSRFALTPDGRAAPIEPQVLEKQRGLEGRIQSVVLRIPGYHFLTQHSQLLYAIRVLISSALTRHNGDVTIDCTGGSVNEAAKVAVEKIAAEVRLLREHVAATGAELNVVFIPSRAAIAGQDPTGWQRVAEAALNERLSRETSREHIAYLDLTAPIRVRALDPDSLYYRHDDHMTPAGYRLIGEEVARFLGNRSRLE